MGLKQIVAGAMVGLALTVGACEDEVSECCEELECGYNSVCIDSCRTNECTKTECIENADGDKECCGCKYSPDDDGYDPHGMSYEGWE